jgi:p-aminobenzoyl-glutamate transporter AbgT
VDPNGQPTAEDDVALLPAGGRTVVAVLDNDFDPAGGVLVVQSVSVKPESGLTVEVIDREKLRISAASGLKSQTSFTYLVSNGATSATGTVVVIPLAPVPTSQPADCR